MIPTLRSLMCLLKMLLGKLIRVRWCVCLCDPVFWQALQIPRDGSSTLRLRPCEIAKQSQIPPLEAALKAQSPFSIHSLFSVFGFYAALLCKPSVKDLHAEHVYLWTRGGKSNPWFMLHALCPWHASGVRACVERLIRWKRGGTRPQWPAFQHLSALSAHSASKANHTVLERHLHRQKSIFIQNVKKKRWNEGFVP